MASVLAVGLLCIFAIIYVLAWLADEDDGMDDERNEEDWG